MPVAGRGAAGMPTVRTNMALRDATSRKRGIFLGTSSHVDRV